jgi:hypothetical protein
MNDDGSKRQKHLVNEDSYEISHCHDLLIPQNGLIEVSANSSGISESVRNRGRYLVPWLDTSSMIPVWRYLRHTKRFINIHTFRAL